MGRILVVDDKELMRDSVGAILSRKGHTVVTASDGKSALARVADKRPECIVTDLQMPGMNGLELLEDCFVRTKCCAQWPRHKRVALKRIA